MSGYTCYTDMENNASPLHRPRPGSSASTASFPENDSQIVSEDGGIEIWPQMKQRTSQPSPVIQVDQMQRYAGVGITISSLLLEKLLSHPCIVLRRQCQVNQRAVKYHQTPFTLVPVAVNLIKRQHIGTLWKGAGSVFIVHGLELATETAISDLLGLPREVYLYSPIKHLLQHIALKSLAHAVVTPFLCASVIETVQSDIASEKPGVLDCLKEGLYRFFQWGKPRTNLVVPIWLLVGPTVMHGILHYSVSSVTFSVAMWYMKTKYEQVDGRRRSKISESQRFIFELMSNFFGSMVADIVLYPLETVIHRLYIQGTRAIIDNLDSGLSVIPVVTKYDGFVDCFQTILQEEGAAGLYRGFGAVILQYTMQALLLKGTKHILDQLRHFTSKRLPEKTC